MAASTVPKLYQSVIDDVINNVREAFIDEGVDEQVLMELKQTWEKKLVESKAIDHAHDVISNRSSHSSHHVQQLHTTTQIASTAIAHQLAVPASNFQQGVLQYATSGNDGHKTVIGMPQKVTLAVPAHQLASGLQTLVSGPGGTTTFALPPDIAATLLSQASMQGGVLHAAQSGGHHQGQQIFQALTAEQLQKSHFTVVSQAPNTTQAQATSVLQLDGTNDTSDEEEEDEFQDDDDRDDNDDDQNDDDNDAAEEEEEPLNSDDDVTDDDSADMFDTDNVVVCQYDKITRSKNRWKFHLKDGIMNLQGKDYVFQRALGDSEW